MRTKYLAAVALSALMLNSFTAQAAGKDGVAAIVNGNKITVAEIKKVYDENPQIQAQGEFETFYNQALDMWVTSALVEEAAKKANVQNSKEYKDMMAATKKDVLSKVYMRKAVHEKITDEEVKKLYEQYKKDFKSEKEIKARHILVDNEATANEVLAKLKAGEKFNDLAAQYSKEKSPDLGYFTKDMMVPSFGEAAFSMKEGQVSTRPIKTEFGYHIIAVDEVRNAKLAGYKEAEPQIKALMSQQIMMSIIQDLNNQAQIEKYSLDGKAKVAAPAAADALAADTPAAN